VKSIKKEYSDRIEYKNEYEQFHRIDGPAVVWNNGYNEWFNNGKPHRENGTVDEYISGTKEWWIKGNRHREDGPAIEYPNGSKFWYLNGKQYLENEYYYELTNIKLKRILEL
jgi:hypothetical protein